MNNNPHFLDYFFIGMIVLFAVNISLQMWYKFGKISYPVKTDKLDLVDLYCTLMRRK